MRARVENLSKVVQMDANYDTGGALLNLGLAYMRSGDPATATTYLQQCYEQFADSEYAGGSEDESGRDRAGGSGGRGSAGTACTMKTGKTKKKKSRRNSKRNYERKGCIRKRGCILFFCKNGGRIS